MPGDTLTAGLSAMTGWLGRRFISGNAARIPQRALIASQRNQSEPLGRFHGYRQPGGTAATKPEMGGLPPGFFVKRKSAVVPCRDRNRNHLKLKQPSLAKGLQRDTTVRINAMRHHGRVLPRDGTKQINL